MVGSRVVGRQLRCQVRNVAGGGLHATIHRGADLLAEARQAGFFEGHYASSNPTIQNKLRLATGGVQTTLYTLESTSIWSVATMTTRSSVSGLRSSVRVLRR